MKKEMLINVLQSEECRIAIVENGVLEELYVERSSQESYVGNIYKGRIVNIEPSIQAAFVDFGIGRNGFLHVSDVDPAYYRHIPMREGGRREHRGGDRGRSDRSERGDRGDRPRREPRPERTWTGPAVPEPGPSEPDDRPFGAGIFDEDALPPEVNEGRSPGEEDGGEDAPGKRKRRRGRPRRGDKAAEGPTAADAPGQASEDETAPGESEGADAAPPRLESAERRTGEDEPSFAGELDPSGGGGLDDDPGHEPSVSDDYADTGTSGFEAEEFDEAPEDEDEPDIPGDEGGRDEGEEMDAPDEGPGRRGRRDRRHGFHKRRLGRDGDGRPKPLIQDIFKRGQEVLVQVIKEGIGTKGPTLSTYISIAGRYLVLMPGLKRIGVSRKIIDEEQRRRLKDILGELHPPEGVGFIIRTAGVDRNKKELQIDLAYLLRIWEVVARRVKKQKAPSPVYQESDIITRTIRDTFTSDIDTVWVDEPTAFAHAQEFLQGVMPRYASRLKLYNSSEPLFHKYKIEEEIARIQQRKVPLPHGGSIVIEQTEALVAIDVNSGSFRADNNAEETAYQMNLLAAKEIARQLRLRDLGGVVINDFIDMREDKHRRAVEKALRDAVKRDRARTKVLRISQFGLIEMTRQRIRPSLKKSVYQDCPHCLGTGHVKTVESMSIDVMRLLQLAAHKEAVSRVQVRVHAAVAEYLLNRKRREIGQLEESGNLQITITGVPGIPP
ncbi:MAG TPA: Rne/Rng family ribonuclease, partial [Gemmataceae bacterium]|nr:Rne/Rng family ribonuclease [Gemmataceae bacterium]